MKANLLIILLLVLSLISCVGEDNINEIESTTDEIESNIDEIESNINNGGGVVVSEDGVVKVTFPIGALDIDTPVKIEKPSSPFTLFEDQLTPLTSSYAIKPEGLSLSKSITIEIAISDEIANYESSELFVLVWYSNGETEIIEVNIDGNDDFKIELNSIGHFQLFRKNPDYTFVPDRNFEQALIDLGYDDVKDYFVAKSIIQNIKALDLAYIRSSSGGVFKQNQTKLKINNFRGLQDFINLDSLNISGHGDFEESITSVDVRKMHDLKYLNIGQGYLKEIDLSQNNKLIDLRANSNYFTSIDLSKNDQLKIVVLTQNSLKTIDLRVHSQLEHLDVGYNMLGISIDLHPDARIKRFDIYFNEFKTLDLSGNHFSELVTLNAFSNELTSIDLSNNPKLEHLSIGENKLESLNLTMNPLINYLKCRSNLITELDLSKLSSLKILDCSGNKLVKLNMKNGNNDNISELFLHGNSELECIQVDDANWVPVSGWPLPPLPPDILNAFSEDCDY